MTAGNTAMTDAHLLVRGACTAALVSILSSALVWLAFLESASLVEDKGVLAVATDGAGKDYLQIARNGYGQAEGPRLAALFPLFPLMIAASAPFFGGDLGLTSIILSTGLFVACAVLLYFYEHCVGRDRGALYAVAALSLAPPGFYFRMAYSESLFLCLVLLFFIQVRCNNRPWIAACICGLATATRPVGICLLPILLWHSWGYASRASQLLIRRLAVCGLLLLVGTSGLLSYSVVLAIQTGNPLAFVSAQSHWCLQCSSATSDKWMSLLTLQSVFAPLATGSPCYWRLHDAVEEPILSLTFANPLYFIIFTIAICIGRLSRLCDRSEFAFGASLLLLGYFMRGHEMCMVGQGRFGTVVFPVFAVAGSLCASLPLWCRSLLAAYCAWQLWAYALMIPLQV